MSRSEPNCSSRSKLKLKEASYPIETPVNCDFISIELALEPIREIFKDPWLFFKSAFLNTVPILVVKCELFPSIRFTLSTFKEPCEHLKSIFSATSITDFVCCAFSFRFSVLQP